MRIHRENKLYRSDNVKKENNCKNYISQLRKDFKYICGYCGKSEDITTKGFEPDHFVPQKIDPSRSLDYSNLVYSCFTCNRKKSGKWPTKDKNKPNDGKVGFIDPISEEYDDHLGRNDEGKIEYYSDIGEYMCKDAFKFDLRPMKEMWKIMLLIDSKEKLAQIKDKLNKDELKEYIDLDEEITKLSQILFIQRE